MATDAEKLAYLKREYISMRKEKETIDTKLKESEAKVKNMEQEISDLRVNLIEKDEQIEKLKNEILNYKESSGAQKISRFIGGFFNSDEQEMKNTTESENLLLKKQIEDLNEEIKGLKKDKTIYSSKLSEAMKNYNDLKDKNEQEIKKIEENNAIKMKEKEDKLNNEINMLQKEIADKYKTYSEQNKRVEALNVARKEHEEKNKYYEKREAELLEKLKKQEEDFKKSSDESYNQIKSLKEQIDKLTSEYKAIKESPKYKHHKKHNTDSEEERGTLDEIKRYKGPSSHSDKEKETSKNDNNIISTNKNNNNNNKENSDDKEYPMYQLFEGRVIISTKKNIIKNISLTYAEENCLTLYIEGKDKITYNNTQIKSVSRTGRNDKDKELGEKDEETGLSRLFITVDTGTKLKTYKCLFEENYIPPILKFYDQIKPKDAVKKETYVVMSDFYYQ